MIELPRAATGLPGAVEDAPLQRLFYSSMMVDSLPVRAGDEVREIAALSAQRNEAAGLTGALVHIEGMFLQVLEGPMEPLTETFERICCDFRHREMRLLELTQVERRIFPQWAMTCLSDGDEETISLADDLGDIRLLASVNARGALNRMRSVLRQHRDQA